MCWITSRGRAVHPRMRGEHVLAGAVGVEPTRSIPACAGNTLQAEHRLCVITVHPRMRGEHDFRTVSVTGARGPSPHARGTHRTSAPSSHPRRSIPACAGNTRWSWRRASTSTVHPRMRGEHAGFGGIAGDNDGPSPHARGTRTASQGRGGGSRSIPACAGNTGCARRKCARRTVHPRMRGEHSSARSTACSTAGPSPHARGTLDAVEVVVRGRRSIPACAGNTSPPWSRRTAIAVHPRMRGEHGQIYGLNEEDYGPSPHARGTRQARCVGQVPRRSIPACAGNTPRQTWWSGTGTVHPRMRGEHASPLSGSALSSGPSPHARGTPAHAPAGTTGQRSIPACAGNTPNHQPMPDPRTVHPRMRGEHFASAAWAKPIAGPSPHARGTRTKATCARRTSRSIPACAGNTAPAACPPAPCTVHPRMRGEHVKNELAPLQARGPSPHARGTRPAAVRDLAQPRSIPACAGNTDEGNLRATYEPVHPRMRGEHVMSRPGMPRPAGPSPHARGTLDSAVMARLPPTVHPRMRGEHTLEDPVRWCEAGPSPHARGTLRRGRDQAGIGRSIPACAGNTC